MHGIDQTPDRKAFGCSTAKQLQKVAWGKPALSLSEEQSVILGC